MIKKTLNGIIAIGIGMFTIAKHMFRPAITGEYPEQKPDLPVRFRGRLAMLSNTDGSTSCSGCGSCARVCPCNDLIQVQTDKDENGKRYLKNYTVDMGRCIFCGNCTEVCPTKAIIMTNEFELADYSRESLVYDLEKIKLSPEESQRWREKLEKDK